LDSTLAQSNKSLFKNKKSNSKLQLPHNAPERATFPQIQFWKQSDIERLLQENDELRQQNKLLRQEIADLRLQLEQKDQMLKEQEKLLNLLENSNVPPSAQHSPFGPKIVRSPPNKNDSLKTSTIKHSKPGRPKGTKGVVRPQREPDEVIEQFLDSCPHCLNSLTTNDIISTTSQIVEDTPAPQPATVIEYRTKVYRCPHCKQKSATTSPETSQPGTFGPHVHTKAVMNSIDRRLPVRKVSEVFLDDFQLSICPATIITIQNRVADTFAEFYHSLIHQVQNLSVVNIDETSFSVKGENWWVWEFTSTQFCVYVIHPSRGKTVLQQVIDPSFKGVAISDRWLAYSAELFPFPHSQFCWAHLTRKFEPAVTEGQIAINCLTRLRELYYEAKLSVAEDPPPEKRTELWVHYEYALQNLVNQYSLSISTVTQYVKLQKALVYLINGFPNWFTFVLVPGVDSTNNRAERDLREIVILRKIKECIRSETSVHSFEILLSVFKTARMYTIPLESFIYDSITGKINPASMFPFKD
jgi:transposase